MAVRIERAEHALHRGIDEIMITRLVAIHIILPQQLDRFGEDRDLRITAIRIIFRRAHGKEPQRQQPVDDCEQYQHNKNESTFHEDLEFRSGRNFWQWSTRSLTSRLSLLMKRFLLLVLFAIVPALNAAQGTDADF